jgi:hypothetical protein
MRIYYPEFGDSPIGLGVGKRIRIVARLRAENLVCSRTVMQSPIEQPKITIRSSQP